MHRRRCLTPRPATCALALRRRTQRSTGRKAQTTRDHAAPDGSTLFTREFAGCSCISPARAQPSAQQGSGKSSLAFDTLYAEGQRRYVESLSAYARQFLGRLDRPAVERIRGLAPTIAIEQKSASAKPRSTVGTITEGCDYLRVLYAKAGRQHCTECGKQVRGRSVDEVVRAVFAFAKGQRSTVLAPLAANRKGEFKDLLTGFEGRGFTRVRIDGGGKLIAEGTPERVAKVKASPTAKFLEDLLARA
jgi:excinuclease UvrABC ATPase subunit